MFVDRPLYDSPQNFILSSISTGQCNMLQIGIRLRETYRMERLLFLFIFKL